MSRKILLVISFLLPVSAMAHHGGTEYALNQTVEFKGKLTRVDLINPHSWLYFDVVDKDGKTSHHRCEMRSVHVLRRSGWTADLFRVGQQITLEASPNGTDPNSCYLQTILFANGTRMDRYGHPSSDTLVGDTHSNVVAGFSPRSGVNSLFLGAVRTRAEARDYIATPNEPANL